MAIAAEVKTMRHRPSPPTSGPLNDLWRIREQDFMQSLKERGVPPWQLTLIGAIKTVGEEALGRAVVGHAEFDAGFELHQFKEQYPLLSTALDRNVVLPEQLAEGAKNIHYGRDHAGLEEALTILPPSIKAGLDNVKTYLPLTERIPITQLSLKQAPPRDSDSQLEGATDTLLYNLNQYLDLGKTKAHTLASIQQSLQVAGRVVIPLKRSSKIFNFWVEGPPIEISADGKCLAGSIKIEAVSFFDRGCDGHRPRVLLMYSVNRFWTKESLKHALRMERELKERIDIAWTVEGEQVQRRPFQGGGFQGK